MKRLQLSSTADFLGFLCAILACPIKTHFFYNGQSLPSWSIQPDSSFRKLEFFCALVDRPLSGFGEGSSCVSYHLSCVWAAEGSSQDSRCVIFNDLVSIVSEKLFTTFFHHAPIRSLQCKERLRLKIKQTEDTFKRWSLATYTGSFTAPYKFQVDCISPPEYYCKICCGKWDSFFAPNTRLRVSQAIRFLRQHPIDSHKFIQTIAFFPPCDYCFFIDLIHYPTVQLSNYPFIN